MDTEYWMGNLPLKLKQIPFIHLAIPGSHDSMTSSITLHSELAPDAEPFLQRLKFLGPILRLVMSRWCKTQDLNLLEQLKSGIRYFDFRVSTKAGSVYPYFVHGLYATEVVSALHDLNNFLNIHPKEVVIIDFQHFYAFDKQDHENLMKLLTTVFNTKLIPYSSYMEHLSLSFLEKNCYQVFIVYRSEYARYNQPLLWPSHNFPTPWPQTVSLPELIIKLNQGLINRSSNYGYVSQFVLTPTSSFTTRHLFSTLKTQCVIPILKPKLDWIQRQRNGPGGVNIIICDFINLDNYSFAKEVINLNFKNVTYENSLTPVDYDNM